jgi:micrococcal nuclease
MGCIHCNPNNKLPASIKWADTTAFVPPIGGGRVIKVYDGDTITVANYMPYKNSPLYRFSVRINGIDCPELKSRNSTEKQCAIIARDTLSKKILNKNVELQNVTLEKYGRMLANVIYKGENCGKYLCKNRLAVPYSGGTKTPPKNWMKYYTSGSK